jgi:hypothetical protein
VVVSVLLALPEEVSSDHPFETTTVVVLVPLFEPSWVPLKCVNRWLCRLPAVSCDSDLSMVVENVPPPEDSLVPERSIVVVGPSAPCTWWLVEVPLLAVVEVPFWLLFDVWDQLLPEGPSSEMPSLLLEKSLSVLSSELLVTWIVPASSSEDVSPSLCVLLDCVPLLSP